LKHNVYHPLLLKVQDHGLVNQLCAFIAHAGINEPRGLGIHIHYPVPLVDVTEHVEAGPPGLDLVQQKLGP